MLAMLVLGCGVTGCSGGGGVSGPIPATAAVAASTAIPAATSPLRATTPATPTLTPTAVPATPTPTAAPTTVTQAPPAPVPPTAAAAPLYPVYSSYFTGKTPFHDTVAQLMAAGATVLSPTIAKNYWAQGVNTNVDPSGAVAGNGPIYIAKIGDPAYTFSCPTYGTCNANGTLVHYPSGAAPALGNDHHLVSFDTVYAHAEIDGWGGDGTHACTLTPGSGLSPGSANCSWGGVFPFSGSGIATDYSGANAGGYAYGLMNVSAQELLNGHIDHALGIASSCLDPGGVYPAQVGRITDTPCPASSEPNAAYGDMIHLKSSVNVANYGYSPYCRTIVRALQTYGAYTADTNGGYGLGVEVEVTTNPAYVTDPWGKIIEPSIVAGGDGTGSGSNFRFSSCFQRIPASDIEVIAISANLP